MRSIRARQKSEPIDYEIRCLWNEIKSDIAWQHFMRAFRNYATLASEAKFHPDQPRVPAGQPGGGQWTSGDASATLIAGPAGRSGYPIDIAAEDQIGGHTFERHVGKSVSYLKGRITGSQRLARLIGIGEKRAGSFASLQDASKVVSATAYQNAARINAWLHSNNPLVPPVLYVEANFAFPT